MIAVDLGLFLYQAEPNAQQKRNFKLIYSEVIHTSTNDQLKCFDHFICWSIRIWMIFDLLSSDALHNFWYVYYF